MIGGWKIQDDILLPIMTDKAPAPEKLLQKIHCNCYGECTSRKCTCRKNVIECSIVCGQCQGCNYQKISKDAITEHDGEPDVYY